MNCESKHLFCPIYYNKNQPQQISDLQQFYHQYITQKIQTMQDSHQENERKNTGRWTREEHQRFMYAIMQYGKDWRKVQQYVKSRSGSQVRSHAQKFFNKMQKGSNNAQQQSNRRNQQHSETEFDIQRQLNNEQTPSTPLELVSLIRRQSKEQGGMIKLSELKKTLQQHQQNKEKQPKPQDTAFMKGNSFKSMSNILSAYEQVNNKEDTEQDQSFFISITKKYKRMFKQVQDFDKLIDLNATNNVQPKEQIKRNRKRSFTLPDANHLSEEQLDVKIENIKKKINPDDEKKQQKRQRKQSDSSIQFTLPPLNKLTTIQEQPQEQFVSFRAVASYDKQEKCQLDK